MTFCAFLLDDKLLHESHKLLQKSPVAVPRKGVFLDLSNKEKQGANYF